MLPMNVGKQLSMDPLNSLRILELCRIYPSSGGLSKKHFRDTVVPNLKSSLSLALETFFPLASNLLLPPDSKKPQIRHVEGQDSVSLVFAESFGDYDYLTGNHPRNSDGFDDLVPRLPRVSTTDDGTVVVPLSGIQVTLFDRCGVCIGFHIHHVAGDGRSVASFIKSWASLSKSGAPNAPRSLLPSYDRSRLRNPRGLELETWFWNEVKKTQYEHFSQAQLSEVPTNKVRITFIMNQATVEQLKMQVLNRYPSLPHSSTFTVLCGFVWSSMVKAREAVSAGEKRSNELEHFLFGSDCRSLLDPRIPATYFGDCVKPVWASLRTYQLLSEDGFLIATKTIAEAISARLYNKEGVLKGAEKWLMELDALKGDRTFGVSSSPKFREYDIDFGWGAPRRTEHVSNEWMQSFSLGMDAQGRFEIGVSFPRPNMEAFASIIESAVYAMA